jgi:pyruvate formate lyase activating enzyme
VAKGTKNPKARSPPDGTEEEIALNYAGKTTPAVLWKTFGNPALKGTIQCQLCAHYCLIKPGEVGKCLVRRNDAGKLATLNWGKTEGLAIDPIEKKPFFHFKPGTSVLSFGAPACNFRCLNCQNWQLSQYAREVGTATMWPTTTPAQIAEQAARHNVDGVAYTYSEPTIFFEYARDTVLACRKNAATRNIFHLFVSNGYFSKEMLDMVVKEKLLAAIRMDLKFIEEEPYFRITGGHLKPVQDSIKRVWDLRKQIHTEVINLMIPGENDSDEQITKLCEFMKSVSPDIPLHFSRFFPYYKMENVPPTDLKRLIRAREIAKEIGLKYVFIGNTNLPDMENTYCPNCNELLVERDRYVVLQNKLKKPFCPKCGEKINIVV